MLNQYLKDTRKLLELKHGKAKFSQSAVAKALDCNRSYISRIESGIEKQPSRTFLQKLSQHYGVDEIKVLILGGYSPEVISKKVYDCDAMAQLLSQLIALDEAELSFISSALNDSDSLIRMSQEGQSKPLLESIYRLLLNFNAKELKALKDDLENYGPTST